MRIVKVVVGTLLLLLGLLWTLQGADLLTIKPILCVANCEPITGGSMLWLGIGLVTLINGIFVLRSARSTKVP